MTPASAPAYPEPLDAIVLAGTDDNPRRMICGENKAFLEIGGQLLVHRVVEALQAARKVGQIFVVGPSDRLRRVLGQSIRGVTVVEQAGKMLANAWQAIHAAEASYVQQHGRDDPARPLLFLSSDLPLISAAAIDDFIDRSARLDEETGWGAGMLAGVAEEASLTAFYPGDSGPGIERPYVHLSDCRLRLANIYVGRPRALSNQAFLQTGFDHRKAEKWKHVLALAWNFLSQRGGLAAAGATLRLQATLLASKRPGKLYRYLRKGNEPRHIEDLCSRVLGGPVRMVITPYGGLSLDVDFEEDYRVLKERFEDWATIDPVESNCG